MSSLSFHYLSMAVHSMIQKNFMEQVKSSGLTSGQPKVLDYLRDHNGANQKEIAAACHIEPGSLTSVLNRMEENGLIERRMLDGNRNGELKYRGLEGATRHHRIEVCHVINRRESIG